MVFNYKEWAKRNRIKLRAYHAEWRKNNKHRIRAYAQTETAKAWRRANDEKPENRRKAVIRASQWAKDNKERVNKRNAKWKLDNPEARARQSSTRRAREMNAEGSHTVEQIKALLIAQNHRCANPYCMVDLRIVKKHLDHQVPLSRGGSNNIQNLQWLCETCNASKWAIDHDAWLEKRSTVRFDPIIEKNLLSRRREKMKIRTRAYRARKFREKWWNAPIFVHPFSRWNDGASVGLR